jgi:multiple sugar transport system ATP-binding protein
MNTMPKQQRIERRDVSIVSTHDASLNPTIRSIVDADYKISAGTTVSFMLKPHKVFLFDSETENRIYFGDQKHIEMTEEN